MKKTQEILGLPIISISDGMEVGRVKNIIINADKGSIDYIVVDSGIQILSARVISSDSILGIGEYALTIENEESINDISKIPAAIDLLQKNVVVKGTKVLTKKGRLVGEIGDIFVDEDNNCSIIGLEFISNTSNKNVKIIPRKTIITFGKNLIVVEESLEQTLLDSSDGLIDRCVINAILNNEVNYDTQEVKTEEPNTFQEGQILNFLDNVASSSFEPTSNIQLEEPITLDENINFNVHTAIEDGKTQDPFMQSFQPAVAEPKEAANPSNAGNLFEQRQKQFLKGKRVTKNIMGNNGSLLISEGTVINDDILELAKDNGKMIELVMNNKA